MADKKIFKIYHILIDTWWRLPMLFEDVTGITAVATAGVVRSAYK